MLYSIKINGVLYGCVSTLTPKIDTEYYYDETTIDGKRHRKLKGIKTNYSIVFYNDLSGSYEELLEVLNGENIVTLAVPRTNGEDVAEFYPDIESYKAKGFLNNGQFFENGLKVSFDRVDYNE